MSRCLENNWPLDAILTEQERLLHKNRYIAINRARWLAYLRMPHREMTTCTLEEMEHPQKRCCLGHACAMFDAYSLFYPELDVVRKDGGRYVAYHTSLFNENAEKQVYHWETSALPRELCQILDMTPAGMMHTSICVQGITGETFINITQVNDRVSGITATQIANIIEENMLADNFVPFSATQYNEDQV